MNFSLKGYRTVLTNTLAAAAAATALIAEFHTVTAAISVEGLVLILTLALINIGLRLITNTAVFSKGPKTTSTDQ